MHVAERSDLVIRRPNQPSSASLLPTLSSNCTARKRSQAAAAKQPQHNSKQVNRGNRAALFLVRCSPCAAQTASHEFMDPLKIQLRVYKVLLRVFTFHCCWHGSEGSVLRGTFRVETLVRPILSRWVFVAVSAALAVGSIPSSINIYMYHN